MSKKLAGQLNYSRDNLVNEIIESKQQYNSHI